MSNERKVWQIATGETGRDYKSLFFDHDIMILGPGDFGEVTQDNEFYKRAAPNTNENQVYNFAREPKPGDRVLMRSGKEIVGVGRIPDDVVAGGRQYLLHSNFACVYGWNLGHCRRAIWSKPPELSDLQNVYHTTKQKPSFSQVHENHILDMVNSIDERSFVRDLKLMPDLECDEYSLDELGVELFSRGVSNRNIGEILKALQQAQRLTSWYRSSGSGKNRPTEHEVVAHILLPLFLGLGWSHQQVAIEWNKIDMAFFKRTPTTEDECVMILEAKGLGRGLGEVFSQPEQYMKKLKLNKVRYVITADGPNLFLYETESNSVVPDPVGYLCVSRLQKRYVLPRESNLVETLVRLQPSEVSDR